ncbi:MAG: hypothetical protein ACKOXB_10725 [Flavobacteriales bacterium]
MDYAVVNYGMYLGLSIGITIWVANTLRKNGKPFLEETFAGDKQMAESVNNLLVVGFYLINVGYMAYTIKVSTEIKELKELIEVLSWKVGRIILILGGMHFFNLAIFFRLRKAAIDRRRLDKFVNPIM